MSVSVDKYFGWTIDLKTDLNCNDFDFYHKFIDKHPNLDQWKNCMPNEIKLILDGMNGLFARLVYVLSVSYDVAWVVSAGITVRDVFEYAGPEQADTMFRFCYDHGLLNEDRETEYVFRMICNLLSINESHSKYGFKLNDGEINCQSKEQAEVLSEFFEDLGFDAMPMQQNPDDTWQLYEEWKLM